MRFYLGTHLPNWLWDPQFAGVPLFVSRRRLERRKSLESPPSLVEWALDSGGFTELSMHGEWKVTPREYVRQVQRYSRSLGRMAWAAPQDWMCEPQILEKTGKTVVEHQRKTVANLIELRSIAPELPWIPVLQGWSEDDYLRCAEIYDNVNIPLDREPVVGLGTICRRQGTEEAESIVRRLHSEGLRIHAFGAKTTGLVRYADFVTSSDSLAWSFNARKNPPLPGCTHATCSNCPKWALRWRTKLLHRIKRGDQD